MRIAPFLALVPFVATAVAHTTVWGVWVNGVDQGDGRNKYVKEIISYPVDVLT